MSREEMFNKFLEVMNRFAQIKAIVAVFAVHCFCLLPVCLFQVGMS